MNSLTINSKDKFLINTLTFWFEYGDAQKAFMESNNYQTYLEVCKEHNRKPTQMEEYVSVDFDDNERSYMTHSLNLDEE